MMGIYLAKARIYIQESEEYYEMHSTGNEFQIPQSERAELAIVELLQLDAIAKTLAEVEDERIPFVDEMKVSEDEAHKKALLLKAGRNGDLAFEVHFFEYLNMEG